MYDVLNDGAVLSGELTSQSIQEENYFSAATLVVDLSDPDVNITVSYDSNDVPIPGHGIEVFAPGLRNPYGICLHSNGYLYGTDNGPNKGE